MKKITLALCAVLFIAITGCNSGSEKAAEPAAEQEQAAPPAEPMESSGAETVNPPHGEPGHVHTESGEGENVSITLPPGGSGTGATGDVKLNPPHGEPGHRCDVAVGAPLP